MKKQLVLSVFGAALGGVLAGCAQTKLEPPSADESVKAVVKDEAKKAGSALSGVTGATFKGSRWEGADASGKPLWRVEAKEIRVGSDIAGGTPKTATFLGAKATLFRDGKPETTLSAPQILFFRSPNGVRLSMSQGVRAHTSGALTRGKAVQIAANRGDVDVKTRVVSLAGDVRAAQGQIKVSSQNLRAPVSLQRLELQNKVTAQNGAAKIAAQSAIYDWKNETMSAKSVVATRENTVLRGQNLGANLAASRGVLSGAVSVSAPNGNASAPRADFDWNRDRIAASSVVLEPRDGGTLRARSIQTDSRLHVASATGISASRDGATLLAASASGFDGLSRLQGRDVTVSRDGLTLRANSVNAVNWNEKSGVLTATGNVRAQNAGGTATAGAATVRNGQISATGGLEIRSDGSVLRARSGQSDLKFQNATLAGDVRATLPNGATFRANSVRKSGEKIVAQGGAQGVLPSGGNYGNLRISAPRLESPDGGATVSASDGVRIQAANGAWATAQTAIYKRASQKILARGGVVFHDPARRLKQTGDSLSADLRLKEAVIENPRGQASGELNFDF